MQLLQIVLLALAVVGSCASLPPSSQFNESLSLTYVHLTWASFCDASSLEAWNCEWCLDKTVVCVGAVYDRLTEAYGFVAYSKVRPYMPITPAAFLTQQVNKTIIVSFRGSSNLPNWIADFDLVKVDFNGTPAQVHAGFYQCWKGLKEQVLSHTKAILAGPCPECTTVFATGHSLGAAISGLAAVDLAGAGLGLQVALANFGMPRLGDVAKGSLSVSNTHTYQRMVHYHDIVPHYPFRDLGYHHVAREIWEITNSTEHKYIVCDGSGEDPDCSDSIPAYEWKPADHNTYMGVTNDGCKNSSLI